jgi:hypothetical protein
MTTTMKSSIGTILAKVAIVLSAAASLIPRRISKCTPHSSADAAAIAKGGRPIAKDWKELSQRRLDQDKASDISETTPDPVSHRGRKAGVVSKSCLGVGVDACVQIGSAPG